MLMKLGAPTTAQLLEAQRVAREEEAKEPKRAVRLSVTYTELVTPWAPGISEAVYRDVPRGVPLEVSQSEYERLEKLGVILDEPRDAATGDATSRAGARRGAASASTVEH